MPAPTVDRRPLRPAAVSVGAAATLSGAERPVADRPRSDRGKLARRHSTTVLRAAAKHSGQETEQGVTTDTAAACEAPALRTVHPRTDASVSAAPPLPATAQRCSGNSAARSADRCAAPDTAAAQRSAAAHRERAQARNAPHNSATHRKRQRSPPTTPLPASASGMRVAAQRGLQRPAEPSGPGAARTVPPGPCWRTPGGFQGAPREGPAVHHPIRSVATPKFCPFPIYLVGFGWFSPGCTRVPRGCLDAKLARDCGEGRWAGLGWAVRWRAALAGAGRWQW